MLVQLWIFCRLSPFRGIHRLSFLKARFARSLRSLTHSLNNSPSTPPPPRRHCRLKLVVQGIVNPPPGANQDRRLGRAVHCVGVAAVVRNNRDLLQAGEVLDVLGVVVVVRCNYVSAPSEARLCAFLMEQGGGRVKRAKELKIMLAS